MNNYQTTKEYRKVPAYVGMGSGAFKRVPFLKGASKSGLDLNCLMLIT